eukprot:1146953-Pelagomonas_calceolata.AAC.1
MPGKGKGSRSCTCLRGSCCARWCTSGMPGKGKERGLIAVPAYEGLVVLVGAPAACQGKERGLIAVPAYKVAMEFDLKKRKGLHSCTCLQGHPC